DLVIIVAVVIAVVVAAAVIGRRRRDPAGHRRHGRRGLRGLLRHLHGDLRSLLDLCAAGGRLLEDLLLVFVVGLDLFGLALQLIVIAFEDLAGLVGGLARDIVNLDHAGGDDEIDVRVDIDLLTVTRLGLDVHALLLLLRVLRVMGAGLLLRVVDVLPRLLLGLAGDVVDLHGFGAGGDDEFDDAVLLDLLTAGRICFDRLALVVLGAVLLVRVDSQPLLDERVLGLVGVHAGHIRDL